jgi:sporulation protein YlmC with PRC-barrel domain
MPKLAHSILFFALATTAATAQTRPGALQTIAGAQTSQVVKVHHEDADTAPPAQMLTSLPSDAWHVTNWYKQDVYDRTDDKIGQILDVMVDHGGKNVAIIIGVGGFLGIGEKDVAVPFDAVHFKKKDNRWQAVINTTKEMLRDARGYKYDRNAQSWVPESASGTTGGSNQK